jgi:phosphoesterase RecJ-like protein
MPYTEATDLKSIIDSAQHIVIIQADNPDADSLGSSLALEHILGDLGKQVSLYCGIDMPTYIRYLLGWDRVNKDLPKQFDASIIVDASTYTLLEKLQNSGQLSWLATKPSIVLDHHATVENALDFAKVAINDSTVSSTGELIYHLAKQLAWPVNQMAGEFIMTAILGDTQGLSNDLARSQTYRAMAELVEAGVNRPQLEELRREYSKMPSKIFKYKAELIDRTELSADGRIAYVSIPQAEINEYSPLYNPAPLIQSDMLQTVGVAVAIVFKQYDDGHVTGAIRSNPGFGMAGQLAEKMGGGGHPNASGFKVTDGRSLNDLRTQCLELCGQLLDNLEKEQQSSEAIQHSDQTD